MVMKNKFTIQTFLAVITYALVVISAQAKPLDTIVATVNDDVILLSELSQTIQQIRNLPELKGKSQAEINREAVESLILQKIQTQRAEQMGIGINDATVNRALAKIAERNQLNATQFRQALAQEGYNYEAFRENVRNQLVINELQRAFAQDKSKTSTSSVNDIIANSADELSQNHTFSYYDLLIKVPANAELAELKNQQKVAMAIRQAIIKGKDIQTYSETSKKNSNQSNVPSNPVIVELAQMEVGEVSQPIHDDQGFHVLQLIEKQGEQTGIKPQELLVRHILIKTTPKLNSDQALKKITQIRQDILSGKDFNIMATQYSDDQGSASQGGELGWATPDTYVPQFAQTALNSKNNEISEPFQTRFGWHILEVKDRRDAITNARSLLEAQARQVLASNAENNSNSDYQQWLKQLRNAAHIEFRM